MVGWPVPFHAAFTSPTLGPGTHYCWVGRRGRKKPVPEPRFEPGLFRFRDECTNHSATAPSCNVHINHMTAVFLYRHVGPTSMCLCVCLPVISTTSRQEKLFTLKNQSCQLDFYKNGLFYFFNMAKRWVLASE